MKKSDITGRRGAPGLAESRQDDNEARRAFIEKMNLYGRNRVPFLFIIDYEFRRPVAVPCSEAIGSGILYDIGGIANSPPPGPCGNGFRMDKHPVPFEEYKRAFDLVLENQSRGDSYLLNLTFPTRIDINLDLAGIYRLGGARYRLLYRDDFVVFSPECFVKISGGRISSYPMKGTINADIPGAEEIILGDQKEFSEHLTIVDLIRNDMNAVASNVRVEDFRRVERVNTHDSVLLQTVSEITGDLEGDYPGRIGDIICSMLPAGSVTGAPKKRTLEIISEAENYDRGYYTGVFGLFDGKDLDSAVMIRFIENTDDGMIYKSGGGITVYSDPVSEYREMVDKVYVPAV
ncbi:MAG: aminodeoxychorismate synthase component I [Spirochaetes bacterium]|nr:aminodeoxychorismate synthase component I [Spirochaetota bacterium]